MHVHRPLSRVHVPALLALGVWITPSLHAQVIVNGDFEDVTGMAPSAGAPVYTGVPIGWTFQPTSGSEANVQILDYDYGDAPGCGEGARYLESHTEESLGTLSQSVSGFTPGESYRLEFLWGNRLDDFAGHPDDDYDFEVGIAGQTFAASGTDLVDMRPESLSFLATSSTHTVSITFHDTGGETHTNGAFDRFVIQLDVGHVGTAYCTAAANSTGAGASIRASGSLDVGQNDFTLTATGLPAAQPGLFYTGPTPIQLAFGDGYRCIGGATTRLNPATMTGPACEADRSLDLTLPPIAALAIPGATLHFQYWYRDPAAGGAGFNLTDAVSVIWQ